MPYSGGERERKKEERVEREETDNTQSKGGHLQLKARMSHTTRNVCTKPNKTSTDIIPLSRKLGHCVVREGKVGRGYSSKYTLPTVFSVTTSH